MIDKSDLAPIAHARVHPRLFCLEAADRVGKTTLAARLGPWLAARGVEARIFREPGGAPRAEEIRLILKNPDNGLSPAQAADLFFEARADLVATTLLPYLAAGKSRVAILDRYFWSTLVYQGAIGGQSVLGIASRVADICEGAIPVQTYLLDLAPEIAHARFLALPDAGGDLDGADMDSLEVKSARRAAYLELAALMPALIQVVDANRTPDELADLVGGLVMGAIGRRKRP